MPLSKDKLKSNPKRSKSTGQVYCRRELKKYGVNTLRILALWVKKTRPQKVQEYNDRVS